MRRLATIACSASVALLLAGAGAVARDAPPLKKWTQGPVRYIATAHEMEAFKMLENDGARAGFIETFWLRRDPTPNTLSNEYRQLFWERVRDANEMFTDRPGEGWKTDRGKILILHGPPTKIEDDPGANTEVSPTAGRGLIRWIYEGRPAGQATSALGPVVVVPFVRDTSGEYRLSHDPDLASAFYTWDDIAFRSQFEDFLGQDIFGLTENSLSVMLDMGRMQEIPAQEEILLDRVDTSETFSHGELLTRIHQYRPPSQPGAVVTFTVSIPESLSAGKPALLARLVPADDQPHSYVLGEEAFKIAGTGNDRKAQARVVVAPGTYDLTLLAVTPRSANASLHRARIAVAPVSNAFGISDVTLASELEPVRYQALATYDEPYVVGFFRVIPRVRERVPRGEDLALFFEVYGGMAPYSVTYRLEYRRGEEWVALGEPVVQDGGQGAQGWAVPTGERWPLGRYRVRIEVGDVEQRARTGSIEFELTDPGTDAA